MIAINYTSPLYSRVYHALREKIENGDYAKGSLLPTENELQAQFNVSRVTIRKAVELLSEGGYVSVKQGRGTEVLDHRTSQKLNCVSSFTETLIERGFEVGSKSTSVEKVIPPIRVANELLLDPNTEVVRLYRIRMANGKPIAIMINYVKSELVPDLDKVYKDQESFYGILEKKYGVVIDSAVENIGARAAGMTEAELLQIPEGSPLLISRRITYSNGKPIEVVLTSIIADCYEYSVFLRGRPS